MATFEESFWSPDPTLDPGIGIPRRDRRGGAYFAYRPDTLSGRSFSIGGAEAADIADAERAIIELDRSSTTLADTEALARLLLRAESVASSHIEGLQIGPSRLLRADAARSQGEEPNDVTAAAVLANIDALTFAIREITSNPIITRELLLETHRRLLAPSRIAEYGGHLRTRQNCIGGSDYNPLSAAFVPPPPDLVPGLIDDLCAFCNEDALPTVAQAAIAHAQFETIHPFADGNGRIGRVLIHLIFRRRGLTSVVSPPVSLILATRARDYVDGLTATRYDGPSDSPQAYEGMNRWLGTFAAACTRAAADASVFEKRIAAIKSAWRERLGNVRSHSTVLRIIEMLPGTPLTTVSKLQQMTGSALSSITEAVARLEKAEILRSVTLGRKRGHVYEAREIIDAFTDLERQLASPTDDTRIETPIRTVPGRPQGVGHHANE
ncbi:MAG: Fic family protein [Vulcanimicrobiaceae bacterium]